MQCPTQLGLFTRARVTLLLSANEMRIQLPCDTELDLVLADCFTPPLLTKDSAGLVVQYAPGAAAYRAATAALKSAPPWLRVWLPVPAYDREWFRSLTPNSKQLGWLWIGVNRTLNHHLIETGHAKKQQALPMSPDYDGASMREVDEDA